jgi:hypothetical protein
MPNLITVKIDVRKLDKSRFFEGKADKDGHRPLYADIVLIARKETGKYGDTHLVKQSKKKDENIELPIIGGATERTGNGGQQQTPTAYRPTPPPQDNVDEDVPF